MLGILLRAAAAASPEIILIISCIMAVVCAAIVACIVITMRAALRTEDPDTREIAYRMFQDLVALLRRRRRG